MAEVVFIEEGADFDSILLAAAEEATTPPLKKRRLVTTVSAVSPEQVTPEKAPQAVSVSPTSEEVTPGHAPQAVGVSPNSVGESPQPSSSNTEEQREINTSSFPQQLSPGFMTIGKLLEVLSAEDRVVLDSVPNGEKNNVFFLVDERKSTDRFSSHTRRSFPDDCGSWNSKKGTTVNNYFLMDSDGKIKSVALRNGEFCFERRIKRKSVFIPLSPQPGSESLITCHRYYATLLSDPGYRKRVSCITGGGFADVAVVEYSGVRKAPPTPHGNSKGISPYKRTDPRIMSKIGEMVATKPARQVYLEMLETNSAEALRGFKQLSDKKYHDARKKKKKPPPSSDNDDNPRDPEVALLLANSQVQVLIKRKGKGPCAILYADEQLEDLKSNVLGCSGNVLCIGKAKQVGNWWVTPLGYKNLAVTSTETGNCPVLLGPVFLHSDTEFETYHAFFSHLRAKLADAAAGKGQLTFGGSQDPAILKAVNLCFPEAAHVLSPKLLRERVLLHLQDDIGCPKKDRNLIAEKLFGEDGLVEASDDESFASRTLELLPHLQKYPAAVMYFESTLKPLLLSHLSDAHRLDKMHWTRNISNALGNILKLGGKVRPQNLSELVDKISATLKFQMIELWRSLLRLGNYQLREDYQHYALPSGQRPPESKKDRDEFFMKFLTRESGPFVHVVHVKPRQYTVSSM